MLKSLDLKSILLILLLGSLTVLVSCSEQESQSTVATTDEPATTEEAEPEVDPALARQRTTHWINEEPIGNNQGPVSIEDLASGNNNPEQWLHCCRCLG